MQTALLTHAHPAQNDEAVPTPTAGREPASAPAPGRMKPRRPRQRSLDSLLKDHATPGQTVRHDVGTEPDHAPGIFLALRVALFFNAGLGIAALLVYETWTMLAR